MKLTKSQLRKIIKEEIEAVVSEDETMGPAINQAAFLPPEVLETHATRWIEELMGPAREAAEAGDPGAQKFLDRVGDLNPQDLVQALIDVTMGERGSDKTIHTLAKSLERDEFGGGYQDK
jgi:hypothetical protein